MVETKEIITICLIILGIILLLINQLGLTGYFFAVSTDNKPKRYVCLDGTIVKDPKDCPTISSGTQETKEKLENFDVVAKCNSTLNGILIKVKSKVNEPVVLKQVNIIQTIKGNPLLKGFVENVKINEGQEKIWWLSDFNCSDSVKVEITYEDSIGLKKDSGEVKVEIYS